MSDDGYRCHYCRSEPVTAVEWHGRQRYLCRRHEHLDPWAGFVPR